MAVINGTSNDDTLPGTAGSDTITGGLGNDLALMGGGNDVFVWNAPDGNDTVEGQGGLDTLRFATTGAAELLDISANGARARLHRDVGNVTMDLNGVERIELWALGGADEITVGNLAGTGVKQVAIDLAGPAAGIVDGAIDAVTQSGTAGNDKITVALANGRIAVNGLAAQMTIGNAEADDELSILGGDGNDVIDASKLAAGLMALTLRGGIGDDRITGSKGADRLIGDDGNDVIIGDDGNDIAALGKGDDRFEWFAGDGHDYVDGSLGLDTVRYTESNAAEQIWLLGSSGSAVITHNAALQVEADNVERVELRALGGADHVIVSDLATTEVKQVVVDLAGTAGGKAADAAIDTVNLEGTTANDLFDISWTGSAVRVAGLAAEVTVEHAGAKDVLYISAGDSNDILNAAGLPAGKVSLRLNGGSGDDTIFGSAGNDKVWGGDGNDVAYLGAGNDEFVWSPGSGDDKVEGQVGFDTVTLSGGALASNDIFYVLSNGERATFLNSGGALDLNEIERIQLSVWGGTDTISIEDLSGTDIKQVAVDLGIGGAGGDGALDSIFATASAGNNAITVAMAAGAVTVSGLPAQVTISHADATDVLVVSAGAGNDVVNAATLPAAAMVVAIDGDAGNDVITGNAANNQLNGSEGNDTLRGGAGADTLNGGFDNDLVDGGIGDDLLYGFDGNDVILGGLGDDLIRGGYGNDTITGGAGNDTIKYENALDGHDVILAFDGDAVGGQDVLNLDALFDLLGVADGDRAGRVQLTDNGGTVDVRVNADGSGGNGFELHVATLTTSHEITLGQDVVLVG